jgi:hypothetical protein
VYAALRNTDQETEMKTFLLPLAFAAATMLAACGDDDVAVVEDPGAPAGTATDTAPPAASMPPAQTEGPVVTEE